MEYFYLLLLNYKYHILLPLDIIEGPIITVIAAFLASQGLMNIFIVYIFAVLGNLIGDSFYYYLGRAGRHTFIKKYGRYVGLTEKRIVYTEEHYKNHLLKTIFFSKMLNAGIEVFLVTAGLGKVKYRKFIGAVLLVEIPKNLVIVLVGYYFGKSYNLIGEYFHDYFVAAFILLGILLSGFIIFKFAKKSKV